MHNHWTTNQFKYQSPYFTEQLISQNELCTTTEHGHLRDKAFMMKIASKRHQVADWIPPPQAGKQLIEAPYPFAETIQQHTISFSFASITTERANQRPCSFSSLYSSRHQYLRVEDNSGRMWRTTIPTSHNIKRILNLQSIKKPNLMHRLPKRTSMAPKSLPSLSDSSHPKVHSSPAPPRPSSRSGPSLAAASPLLAPHNHGHKGFKHNLVTFLYPFS